MSLFGKRQSAEDSAVKLDRHTNLPELPEPFFWRVGHKEGLEYSWDCVDEGYGIAIYMPRKKKARAYFRSKIITTDIERGIRAEAGALERKLRQHLKDHADKARLRGDYPPERMP